MQSENFRILPAERCYAGPYEHPVLHHLGTGGHISYIHIYSYIMKSTSEHAEVNASSLIVLHPGIGTIRLLLFTCSMLHNAICEKVVSRMDCVSGSITLETQ
jgi:hypothetical protein